MAVRLRIAAAARPLIAAAARPWIAVAAMVPLAASLACGRVEPERARSVVLVTIDTLRADHVGAYGYPLPTSPHLDAFRRRATLHSRAQASSPWTLPTHASIFTGLDPFEHGAHSVRDPNGRSRARPLGPDQETLAEALRAQGFRTGAFAANTGYLAAHFGLDQGFESYEVVRESGVDKNPRIFAWIDRHAGERFFLFVNYMDAHRPYNSAPVEGGPPIPAEAEPGDLDALYRAVMPGGRPLPHSLAQRVVARYDAGIANADRAVGALLEHLRASGLEDETLVVITSDHGEYFGEHDLVEHSKDIYQEALWIPLLIRDAGQQDPRRDDTPIASSQLAHRIMSGVAPDLARRFPRRAGEDPVIAENHYARDRDLRDPRWGHRFERVRRAVYAWPLKWIHSSDGAHELYDLADDPAERHDLANERREDAERLQGLLDERLSRRPEPAELPPPPPLGEPERRELEALGYVDS